MLDVNFTWSLERTPSWGMLVFELNRTLPETSDWHDGFHCISVIEMHKVLRENLVWV